MNCFVKDTSREDRLKIAKNALAISVGSNVTPTKETIEVVKQFVDGKMDVKEVQKKVIERYKKI